jgi:hypothetical protein
MEQQRNAGETPASNRPMNTYGYNTANDCIHFALSMTNKRKPRKKTTMVTHENK